MPSCSHWTFNPAVNCSFAIDINYQTNIGSQWPGVYSQSISDSLWQLPIWLTSNSLRRSHLRRLSGLFRLLARLSGALAVAMATGPLLRKSSTLVLAIVSLPSPPTPKSRCAGEGLGGPVKVAAVFYGSLLFFTWSFFYTSLESGTFSEFWRSTIVRQFERKYETFTCFWLFIIKAIIYEGISLYFIHWRCWCSLHRSANSLAVSLSSNWNPIWTTAFLHFMSGKGF